MRGTFARGARWSLVAGAVLLALMLGGAAFAATLQVTGTASYRERIALPPGAVFQAVLEDVSVADAPAKQVAEATLSDPGAPPFQFKIDYDPADVAPDRTYSVRTQVTVGRKLIFVSDTMNPVLTQGAPDAVDVQMIKVGDTTPETDAPATIGAHGLKLPASFTGTIPCADCDTMHLRLDLWPDQVFHLRRSWTGKGGKEMRRDSIGRWSVDPDTEVLALSGPGDDLQMQIVGDDRMRLISRDGKAIESGTDYVLTAGAAFEPFEPHLPLRGMLTYVADQARFTECLTGRDYPLIKDGDYEALEHAYLAAGAEAGGPIMASFDGGIMQTPKATGVAAVPGVLVERFVGVWPGETCERTLGAASLTNTYWKILRLDGSEVAAGEGRREPNLILREGDPRYTATVGCNELAGSFTLMEKQLSFGPAAATAMACPAPLDGWEKQLSHALAATASWRIEGQTLELLDAAGNALALLQAVYLY